MEEDLGVEIADKVLSFECSLFCELIERILTAVIGVLLTLTMKYTSSFKFAAKIPITTSSEANAIHALFSSKALQTVLIGLQRNVEI